MVKTHVPRFACAIAAAATKRTTKPARRRPSAAASASKEQRSTVVRLESSGCRFSRNAIARIGDRRTARPRPQRKPSSCAGAFGKRR
jgi:hypothetical protein